MVTYDYIHMHYIYIYLNHTHTLSGRLVLFRCRSLILLRDVCEPYNTVQVWILLENHQPIILHIVSNSNEVLELH